MKYVQYMKTAMIAAVCGAIGVLAEDTRPNILFIMTDDQNIDTLSAYGGDGSLMPHVEQLAEAGMVFRRAYVPATSCVPSRYALLTGSYPSRNTWQAPPDELRTVGNNCFFTEDTVTVAEALRSVGYETGFAGKEHSISSSDYDFIDLPADSDPADPQVVKTLEHNYRIHLQKIKDYGFDYAAGLLIENPKNNPLKALRFHCPEWNTKGAVDFLDARDRSKPFFLWFALTLPHGPQVDIYNDNPRVTPIGYRDDHLGVMPSRQSIREAYEASHGKKMSARAAWQTLVDQAVAAVLKKLDEQGASENTMVVFMTDHQLAGKTSLYERGTHIPLFIRWPRVIKPGSVCDKLVGSIDLPSTWLDAAGAQALPGMQIDGKSILPLLRGEPVDGHKAVFSEMGYGKSMVGERWKYIAIRYPESLLSIDGFVPPQTGNVYQVSTDGTFAMVPGYRLFYPASKHPYPGLRDRSAAPDQLYDLENDPMETNNLAGNPEYATELKRMQDLLSEKIKKTGRPFGEF